MDGQEEEVDLDAMKDEDLTRELQLARAARRRMNEAAEERKRIREALEYGKTNPDELLRLAGIEDPDAFWEERLAQKYGKQVEESRLTPEQKRIKELEAKAAEYEKRETDAKQAREAAARAEFTRKVEADLLGTFEKALKAGGLPLNQRTQYQMAETMRWGLQHGIKFTPEQLVSEVKAQYASAQKELVSGLDGDSLLEWLGEETVKKVLRARIAKTKVPVVETAREEEPRPAGPKGNAARVPFHLQAWASK